MDNDIAVATAAEIVLATDGGRPSRRSKAQVQKDRGKNQENVQSVNKVDMNDRSGSEKRKAKQKSKVNTTPTNNSLNSSTPRRKKDPLANLLSNLSPKYIGRFSPTSLSDTSVDERVRATRSRRNISNSNNNNNVSLDEGAFKNFSVDMAELAASQFTSAGYVRLTTKAKEAAGNRTPNSRIRRREYVSPIDKLLRKNGSTMVGIDQMPFEDSWTARETSNRDTQSEQDYLKEANSNDLKKPNNSTIIDAKLIGDFLTDEYQMKSSGVELKSAEHRMKNQISEKQSSSQGNSKMKAIKIERQSPSPKEISSKFDFFKDTSQSRQSIEANELSEKQISNSAVEAESTGSKKGFSHSSIKSDRTTILTGSDNELKPLGINISDFDDAKDMHDGPGQLLMTVDGTNDQVNFTDNHAHFSMENAVKSPSAISMDSAKGSSVLNEGSWMTFQTGDLFWGQIYTYCYWPCMVCPDPEGKTISAKELNSTGDQHVLVHVRFFADNGRRNWVKRENLMPFTTLQNYQDRLDEVRNNFGTKSSKYKLLVPKKGKVSTWHGAVSEMELVAAVPHEQRLEKFFEIFEQSKIFQKTQKIRRKSLYVPLGRRFSFSDAESQYGSSENVDKLSVLKRERDRSVSPYSPAFSPVKMVVSKKRKFSNDNDHSVADFNLQRRESESSEKASMELTNDQENSKISQSSLNTLSLEDAEFKGFYKALREFVLEENQNHDLEKSLFVAIRNIWALKLVSKQQMEQKRQEMLLKHSETVNDSAVETSGGAVKRLSSRLRNLVARKSLVSNQPTPKVEQPIEPEKEVAVEKSKKRLNRPILEVIDDIFQLDSKYLFKGLGREPVCKYCFKPGGALKRCSKNCHYWLHSECLTMDLRPNSKQKRGPKRQSLKHTNETEVESRNNISANASNTDLAVIDSMDVLSPAVIHVTSDMDAEVICKECANDEPAKCMVCKLTESGKINDPLVKCCTPQCDRAFHPACCKYWPQSKITISKNHIQSFRCPSHVCHTCVSDDPKGKFQHISNTKITKCVKCPATFHTDSTCIPAGSQILTSAHIICPRHASSRTDMTVNVNWCFICVGGGQLVCCETCPTAVHAQCLKIPIDANEGYICEECESGRMPLYGEMVWAKFTNFRWWPAIILPPTEIPQNIVRKNHNPSDFVVRFFGTHDHGWISRRRVYLYVEGDSSEPPKSKSGLDLNYVRGIKEAKEVYEIIKAKKIEQRNSNESKARLFPQPYTRIKANRAVPPVKLHFDLESVSKCDCDPNDVNPCGPESNCLNRVLYHECNPKLCPAGESCQNQMFESRVMPRLDVVYMKERGFGLVCREPIAAGTFIIEYVGEIINDQEFRARMAQKSQDRDENFYFLSVEKDYIIDAGPKGNMARFMNHSCDPNCETQKWTVNSINRVGLFAIKDIPENTELTFNYHWDDLLGNEKKTCFCGSKNCAGQIGGKIKDEPKEPSINSEIAVKTKKKRKLKMKVNINPKPLKRLKTIKGKRTTSSHTTNKMAAAAAVAMAMELEQASTPIPNTEENEVVHVKSPSPD